MRRATSTTRSPASVARRPSRSRRNRAVTEEDLGAIYDWLRTRPAKAKAVVKYTAP
jgi:hypothetical protein